MEGDINNNVFTYQKDVFIHYIYLNNKLKSDSSL